MFRKNKAAAKAAKKTSVKTPVVVEKKGSSSSALLSKWKRLRRPHQYNPVEHDSLAGKPLLKDDGNQKRRKTKKKNHDEKEEWEDAVAATETMGKKLQACTAGFGSKGHNSIHSFAAKTAFIASTFSDETKSTQSGSDLYHPDDKEDSEIRVVHPVVCKRDIFLDADFDFEMHNNNNNNNKTTMPSSKPMKKTKTKRAAAPAKSMAFPAFEATVFPDDKGPSSLPPFSVTGSMLYNNIESGKLKEGETKAAGARPKLMSPPRPHTLPPNTIMASMVYRTLQHTEKTTTTTKRPNDEEEDDDDDDEYDENKMMIAAASGAVTRKKKKRTQTASRPTEREIISMHDKENASVPCDIKSQDAQSSVSSVTMYSSYHHDPMVRASKNLLDILRSNRFEEFAAETQSNTLYEA